MRKILIILAVLSLSYSCQEKKEVVEEPQKVDSTLGIIDNSKIGIVDEDIDDQNSFEGKITYQLIIQAKR